MCQMYRETISNDKLAYVYLICFNYNWLQIPLFLSRQSSTLRLLLSMIATHRRPAFFVSFTFATYKEIQQLKENARTDRSPEIVARALLEDSRVC